MDSIKTLLFLSIPALHLTATGAEIDFAKDIQPIFAEHCNVCHGPDQQKGGLNLTNEKSALGKLKSGETAVIAGKPEASEIIYRLTADDPDELMPPADHGPKLKPEQINLIKKWISEGAEWSQHWAYRPLNPIAPPKTPNEKWIRNSIDRFVLTRLNERNLSPSPTADRRTLIKRLSYDLIGLPPTPDEVTAFVNDTAPDAYSKVVNRLLASPHFGERWGRHWLDKARYADSDGYEKDRPRMNAWRYRDWVINSINADLPFDQFTIEQLAGDLLPNATELQKLATAFNRQTLTNTEGGTDQEQWRVAAVMDRVETVGSVWLGLTVGCARCHNHKYDQLTQKEYYQLFAYFNNGDESSASVPRSRQALIDFEDTRLAHEAELSATQKQIAESDAALQKRLPEFESQLRKQIANRKTEPVKFHTIQLASVRTEASDQVKFTRQDGGSLLVSGANPATAEYEVNFQTKLPKITGIKIEVLPDPSLGAQGPGRTPHGNFVLNDVRIYATDRDDFPKDHLRLLKLAKATADYSQKDWPANAAIDGKIGTGKDGTGWAVGGAYGKPHHLIVTLAEPVEFKTGVNLHIVLDQKYGSQHTIGRFRITARTGEEAGDGIPETVLKVLAKNTDTRSKEDTEILLSHIRAQDKTAAELQAKLKKLQASAPKPPVMSVRVISQRTNSPRKTHILNRGEFKQPLDAVNAGTPSTLPQTAHRAQGDRLDLAQWLVNGTNPITPRVTVNHLWANLFGHGLVRTMNDFGLRGDAPSHPELLDWLSAEFIRLKWSRKEMIRLITHSATYRQSSAHRPELAEKDPNNHWLHRQNRFRVEAELIRDLTLAASGQLSRKVGGPSVYPPLPNGVAQLSYANNFKWKTSTGEDRYRRGLYTFFKRTSPHPNLITFDCPDSNVTCVKRNISNTPLAALTTLNNSVFTDSAKAMAKRLIEECETDSERIALGFTLCTAREATPEETAAFTQLLKQARDYYTANDEAAKTFNGDAEASSWAVVTRVFLNLDEFITRE